MATAAGVYEEKQPLLCKPSFRGSGALQSGYHQAQGGNLMIQLPGIDPVGNANAQAMGDEMDRGDEGTLEQVVTKVLWTKVALVLVTIFYFLGYIPSMVIMNPYIYDRVAKEFPEFNTSSQMPCVADMNNNTWNISGIEVQNEIERRVSTLELYLHLTTYLPAILPILFLGPFSDKFGRKVGFFLPIIGTTLKQVVYISTVELQLPLSLLYLAHAVEACGGSFAGMLSAIFSVTSDITRKGPERSGWIAVMEALQTLAASAGQIYTAQWMRHGYFQPLICALCFCFLAFLVVSFLFRETRDREANGDAGQGNREQEPPDEGQNQGQAGIRQVPHVFQACWNLIKEIVAVYTRKDADNQSRGGQMNVTSKRLLCLVIFILTVAVNFSRTGVEALFQLKYPLCWFSTKVYTFNGLRIFLSWIAILFALAVMQKVFKMADRHVAIVGIVSSILSNAALSFAVNDVMVYEAAVVGFMNRSIIPMLRSVLSSLVGQAHQGAMYSGLSCIESLGPSVFSTIANRIYYASLASWAGEIFIVFACMMAIALFLLLILNVMFARENATEDDAAGQGGNIQDP